MDDAEHEEEDLVRLEAPTLSKLLRRFLAEEARWKGEPSTLVLVRAEQGNYTEGLQHKPLGLGHVVHARLAQVPDGTYMWVVAYQNPHAHQGSVRQRHKWCQEGFGMGPSHENALVSQRPPRLQGPASRTMNEQERERIKKQLYMLHSATGHVSTASLVNLLKRRQARPEVIELAKEFKCSVCAEAGKLCPDT